jgi:glyoxylase-like metal-dependent hydrolase (beta-lactamase superfamily II)
MFALNNFIAVQLYSLIIFTAMQIHSIETGLFKLDGGAMFGVVPKSMWQKVYAADEKNMCTWAMRCMLIEDGPQLILIDTGIGNKQDDKFFSHFYLHGNDSLQKSIEAKGYSLDDVTDVVLTHLHFDHCGGAIAKHNDGFAPVFKNAKYWSNETHWQNACAPNAREKASFLKENILPIQESGQLHFVQQSNPTIIHPSIDFKFVNGHSEGMMLPLINTSDGKILYCADLFPSSHHVALPWIMGYDMQPLLTLSEKEMITKEALENNYTLFFEHDKDMAMGKLQMIENKVKVVFLKE